MIALLEAHRAGLLQSRNWLPNILAGIIVGVVALPLAMAFAIASGVKPEQGLYTAIIAGFIVGIFGGSRVQIAGPTGAFIAILVGIAARYGVDGLQIASLIAGFMLLLMGFLKLGNAIKFIPEPVIVGFTSGIGLIIFVGEWKDFFGLSLQLAPTAHFHEKLFYLVKALPHLHLTTTLLACLSLLLVIATPRISYFKRIPGPLVALVVVTLLQAIFHFKGVATVGSLYGGIPQHLPHLQLPSLSFNKILALVGPAFSIAMLGAIESLLSATVADGMAHTHHDSNQELIGQGLANILCPLFGGFAATGAIARTATNIRNGGNSPIGAITHSVTLILIILLLAPLAFYIPLATLAAILFVVAYNMSEIKHFAYIIKRAPSYDVLILMITFLLTVFTDLVVAVSVGVILATLLFVRRMSQAVSIDIEDAASLQSELPAFGQTDLPSNTLVYTVHGPFFFGAAGILERTLATTQLEPKAIIFRLKQVPFMDITGLEAFYELVTQLSKQGISVYLCEANARVSQKLAKIDIFSLVKEGKVFPTLAHVLENITS